MNQGNIPQGKHDSIIEQFVKTYLINVGISVCSMYRFCKAASHYPTCEGDSIGMRDCFDPTKEFEEMMKKRNCGGCGGDGCG